MFLSPRRRRRCSSVANRSHLKVHEVSEVPISPCPRQRTCSLPASSKTEIRRPRRYLEHPEPPPELQCDDDGEGVDFYRCRSFSLTSKGIKNMGDSMRSRSNSSGTNTSSLTTTSSGLGPDVSSRTSSARSLLGTDENIFEQEMFHVAVMGASSVGKTSVVRQFMTSEYVGGSSTDESDEEKKHISILLDGEESFMFFKEQNCETDISLDDVHCFVVVFSMGDRKTFETAVDILFEMRQEDGIKRPIILVANKCDLVRTQAVSTNEGKEIAITYRCKFIETSVVLGHNIDELLVGILRQTALFLQSSKHGPALESVCFPKSKNILTRIFKKTEVSHHCENLFQL